MEIKDFLHLYLGCQCIVCDVDGQTFEDQVESVIKNKAGQHKFSIYEFGDCPFNDDSYYQWIKPILRPLSSMTEEEAKELGWWDDWDNKISYAKDFKSNWMFSSLDMLWLLKNSFDIFNLIPAGLAIDRVTTLKH